MKLQINLIFQVVLVLLIQATKVSTEEPTKDHDCKFSVYNSQVETKLGMAKIKPLIGKRYTSKGTNANGGEYQYNIGICTSALLQPTKEQIKAGVTQEDISNGNPEPDTVRMIGLLNNTHIMAGSDWVILEYKGGQKYHSQNHCGGEAKRSVIVITCGPGIDDDDAEMVFMEEQNQKQVDCYYLFEMKHQAVCPAAAGGQGLSVGSIFVIVFFTLVAVYLLVGFAYSRYVLGAKGFEQIPNYEFWQDFGNLQADGCEFLCRSREARPTRYGGLEGLGDNQLDTEEPIRDESLLPM